MTERYRASAVTLTINGKRFAGSGRGLFREEKPRPEIGQRWRMNNHEGVIVRMLPGGGGDLGIVEFDGEVPSAHVSTMLRFPAWQFVPTKALPPPCTCVTLEGGVIIADGCAMHSGAEAHEKAQNDQAEARALHGRSIGDAGDDGSGRRAAGG